MFLYAVLSDSYRILMGKDELDIASMISAVEVEDDCICNSNVAVYFRAGAYAFKFRVPVWLNLWLSFFHSSSKILYFCLLSLLLIPKAFTLLHRLQPAMTTTHFYPSRSSRS